MPVGGRSKTVIARGWLFASQLRRHRPKLTILYYHAVPLRDAPSFERQMAWLAANANIVYANHEAALDPSRPNVAVTFDDAYETVVEYGAPALIKHGVPSTIYVPTGWIGRNPGWQMEGDVDQQERVMDVDSLQRLPKGMFRFGSHTVSHPRLSQLDPSERRRELVDSRATLETMFGGLIDTLAFPYGDHDQATIDDARAAGYRYVFSIMPDAVRPTEGRTCRGRTAVDASDPLPLFALKASGAFEWLPLAIRAKAWLRQMLRRENASRFAPS